MGLSTFRGQEGGDGLGRSAQDRYLSLRLGLGRDLRLWRGFHISASASAALRKHVGRATTFPAHEPALYMPASSVGMGIELAPRWRFTKELGLRLPLGLDYYPSSYHLTTPQRTYGLSPVSFYGGTALEVYL